MARKIRKTKRNIKREARRIRRNISRAKPRNGFFKKIQFTESYTSLILGAIVFLVVGILFISFPRVNKNTQISTITDTAKTVGQNSNTSSTYTVNMGDDLWSISENVYKDGYKWVEIARVNKLENPGLIHTGDKLVIPSIETNPVQDNSVAQNPVQDSQTQNPVITNNSITGNSYTVVRGDNLWDIAVRAYGDGFKWPEIAHANHLVNPDLIHAGNVFIIPRQQIL